MEYKITEPAEPYEDEFGIALFDCGKMLKALDGLSANRQDIEELTRLLNELEVEPCHFEDIIEDYLTDFCL